jgi:iron complex transport system substrate-binding protein
MSVLSTTHIGMLTALNKTEVITSVSDMGLVYNKKLKERLKLGSIRETGGFGLANLEVFLSLSPSAIVYSGFDENNPVIEKLAAANLKTLANYEWKETHPLGRAEWIKYFGVLIGEEEAADSIFHQIKLNYNKVKDSIAAYATQQPSVLVGTPYGDQFNVPAGNSYMAKMLKDLKVNYVYANTEGVASHSYSLEKVISENKHTDYWLNVAASSKEKLLELNKKFELLEAVHNGGTFSYFSRVNKFWEESAVRPDLLLLDLAAIFHPDLFKQKQMNYYSVVR